MLKWLGLIGVCVSLQAIAEANNPYCDIYQKVTLGMSKMAAIEAVGEPFNHSFEMKPEGGSQQHTPNLHISSCTLY